VLLLHGSTVQFFLPLPPALLPPAAGYVLKCMLSPDVRQLATTSSDKTVKLWNLDGFTLDRTLAGVAHLRSKKLIAGLLHV